MTWLMVVLMLALSSPAFGQMATTTATSTPPYDVSTVEGYREWAIRFSAALCLGRATVDRFGYYGDDPPEGWPAVDDISDAKFDWRYRNNRDASEGFMLFSSSDCYDQRAQGSGFYFCFTEPPYSIDSSIFGRVPIGLGRSCAQLRLPPIGASLTRASTRIHSEAPVNLPPGYSWYGERPEPTPPPTTRRPPTTPEPELETPQEPVGNLEVPANGSFQSGIGYVSGWVCEAERVSIVIDGGLYLPPVARNIARGDTEEVCGDQDNGFILHWNYNLMGDGTYTAALVVDGKTLQENRFTVTTLGEEFVRGVERDVVVNDFPGPGENTRLRWQEPVQGFVLVPTD